MHLLKDDRDLVDELIGISNDLLQGVGLEHRVGRLPVTKASLGVQRIW